jgi:hypothetical protein
VGPTSARFCSVPSPCVSLLLSRTPPASALSPNPSSAFSLSNLLTFSPIRIPVDVGVRDSFHRPHLP